MERKVSKKEAEEFSQTNNLRYCEVSAKNGENIKILEEIISNSIYERRFYCD